MGDVVNLNRFRKAQAKARAAGEAEINRARFGRSKVDKAAQDAERDAVDRTLDGAKREDD